MQQDNRCYHSILQQFTVVVVTLSYYARAVWKSINEVQKRKECLVHCTAADIYSLHLLQHHRMSSGSDGLPTANTVLCLHESFSTITINLYSTYKAKEPYALVRTKY